jgi:hypothetical protein
VGDDNGSVVKRIVRLGDAVLGSGGRRIDLGRAFHSESRMGPVKIEVLDEGVELGLLLQDVLVGRSGGFLLQGQVHAFMASVLLGMSGTNAFDRDAHHTESLERLNRPLGEAKGTPLSERMAKGQPLSLKRRSKAINAVCSRLDSRASYSRR